MIDSKCDATPSPGRGLLSGIRWREFLLPYGLSIVFVVVMMLLVDQLELRRNDAGLILLAVFAICAWFTGLGPALLMCPVIYVVSRWTDGRPWTLSRPEIIALTVTGVILAAVGSAGQYRRRFRIVTRAHSQKLRDQSRALSLAHIVFCDVDGRVTEWNEGITRMFGWTSEEAVGRDLHELLKTQLPRPLQEIQVELLQFGQWEGEVIHHHKDGTKLIIATHWILYQDEQRRPVGVAKIHNDISKLRRVEEAVREADRRKDEFLALLAHELRNPLAPIRMGLELLRSCQDDPDSLEEIRMTMERQTQQLVTLVDDLLDVSRITRGKLELRKTRVNLAEVIESAVEASRPFVEQGQHVLTVEAIDPRIHLDADPHRLAQVFSNLLNNAAKFTTCSGHIRLSARREGETVFISVKDDGIGIAPDKLEQIFEMFTQIESPQAKGNSGLGIGLTLVKSLIEMHGGRVEVASDGAMQGSEFTVCLPILTETFEKPPKPVFVPREETAGGFGRKVLLVDDNVAALSMLSMMMESLGNEVRTAYNGQEAIEVADDFRPEVILMDLGMPKMNGYDAARHIRKKSWGQDIFLVALSGWGQEEDKRRTKEAGFDVHLTKPAEPAELRQLLASPERIRG